MTRVPTELRSPVLDAGTDATVLVVDPDGVSRRFVELALRGGAARGA